jgi:hypothetical protein
MMLYEKETEMNFQTYLQKTAEAIQDEQRQHAQAQEDRLRVQTEKAWQDLIADTGSIDDANIYAGFVTTGDVVLNFHPTNIGSNSYWSVQGKCPRCGMEVVDSRDCRTIEQIAQQYVKFEPHFNHICRQEPEPMTAGERLLDAFQEFILEITANS